MVSSFFDRKRLVLNIYEIFLSFKVLEIYFYLVKSGKNTANQSDEEAEKVSKKMFRQQSSNLSDLTLSNQKSKVFF